MSSIRGHRIGTTTGNDLHVIAYTSLLFWSQLCPIWADCAFRLAYRKVLEHIEDREEYCEELAQYRDDQTTFRCMSLYRQLRHMHNEEAPCSVDIDDIEVPVEAMNATDYLDDALYCLTTTGSSVVERMHCELRAYPELSEGFDRLARDTRMAASELLTPDRFESGELISVLFNILVDKFIKASRHHHIDLAFCYLREILMVGWIRERFAKATDERSDIIMGQWTHLTMPLLAYLARQAYGPLHRLLCEYGLPDTLWEAIQKAMTYWEISDYSDYSDEALIGLCQNRKLKICCIESLTEHQYQLLLGTRSKLLNSRNDFTIHRPMHFPDVRLLAFAPEEAVNQNTYITRTSAGLLTVDRIRLLMASSPNMKMMAENWLRPCMLSGHCRYGEEYRSPAVRCYNWAISEFLPFMPRKVILFVRSIRGPCPPSWIDLMRNRATDRRLVARIALAAGIEDWYRDQKWYSIDAIFYRMSGEVKRRYIGLGIDPYPDVKSESDEDIDPEREQTDRGESESDQEDDSVDHEDDDPDHGDDDPDHGDDDSDQEDDDSDH
jgi:hypothetical protein